MEDNLSNFGNQTQYLERALGQNAKDQLQGLTEALAGPMPDAAARNVLDRSLELIKGNLSVGAGRAQELHSRIGHLTLSPLPRALELIELFRWPATIGLLCVLILVCLLLLWGVIRHSRCLLILFSVLGLLSVVLCWVLVSLYLGICVAGSDFCLDPEPFLQKQSSGMVDNAVLNYYLHCRHDSSSPFVEPLREARAAVDGVQTLMAPVTQIADRYFPRKEVHSLLGQLGQELNGSQSALGKLGQLLDCRPLNREYHRAMDATCTGLLEGTAFMLASALGGGLLFTVLIWVASHTWIHIRQRRPRDTVDEEDPFLPPSAVGAPRRSRDTNGRTASREEQAFLQARYTPPPTASMRPVASDSWEPLLASRGGVTRRGVTPERALSFSFVSFATTTAT
nr:protein tweety-like isoform X1 [Rhipicephalus microplus]